MPPALASALTISGGSWLSSPTCSSGRHAARAGQELKGYGMALEGLAHGRTSTKVSAKRSGLK